MAQPGTDETPHGTDLDGSGTRLIRWLVAAAILLVVLFVIVWAIFLRGGDEDASPDRATATPGEILDNPDQWVGKRVTLSAPIDGIVPPAAFELEGGLLVVAVPGKNVDETVENGWEATVVGEVVPFDLSVIEREAGVEITDRTFDRYVDQVMIMPERIEAGAVQGG